MGVKRNLDEAGISNKKNKFTEDEAALYDRQIRLWGMDCQNRLREAQVLVIGLNGVGVEVVKNLTLSGIKSITILDDTRISVSDSTAQFFVAASEPGKKRSEASISAIQELNPNVKVVVATGDPNEKPEKFFTDYEAIFATACPMDVLIKINKICREHSMQFYCADTWGFYGYCFLDLKRHKFKYLIPKPKDPKTKVVYQEEKALRDEVYSCPSLPCLSEPLIDLDKYRVCQGVKPGIVPKISIPRRLRILEHKFVKNRCASHQTLEYSSLAYTMLTKVGEGLKKRVNKVFILLHIVNHFREMFNRYPLPASRDGDIEELKKIRAKVCSNLGCDAAKITDDMLSCLFGELSPVCAVVGGVMANEIIKGLTRRGFPVFNYFLFDGNEFVGVNETIGTT